MTKLVVINLGSGDLFSGFPQVTARLWTEGSSMPEQFLGELPPAPGLVEQYRYWQAIYRCLCIRQSLRSGVLIEAEDELEIDQIGITNVSQFNFNEVCQQFSVDLNRWLASQEFLKIERSLRSQLHPTEDIRIILETNDEQLRRLPWHQWNWFEDYPKADIAFSKVEHRHILPASSKRSSDKTRILAILGNSQGIDLDAEVKFLNSLQDAEIQFLVNPSRQEFNIQLWDAQGWDILFFAGHSQTEAQIGRLYINEDSTNNSITTEQLEEALKAAIEQGLKLAIFNSCDGLGLALALEQLHIPVVIVMQEAVPNYVAQAFFDYFLEDFVREHLPLHHSIRRARRKLQGLENEYPGASWLPIVSQNPLVNLTTWLQLRKSSPDPRPLLPNEKNLYTSSANEQPSFRDWGEAPDSTAFYGRTHELATLEQWIIQDRCRLIALLGMGGMGKTTLAVKLAEQVQDNFEFVIWRSLLNAPPMEEILEEIVQFFSHYKDICLPETVDGKLSYLINHVRQHRCLIILDNVETVLQSGTHTGSYRPGYEKYGRLLQNLGEVRHQSCLILTSREKNREVALLEGAVAPVRALPLQGLALAEGKQLFESKGCFGLSDLEWCGVLNHYAGNPLALNMVAALMQDLADGDMAELLPYLRESKYQFRGIDDLLTRQFERLSSVERQVMYWLAVNRETISLTDLQSDIVSESVKRQLLDALQSLGRRCLVERIEKQWSLQPVVMEYVTNRLANEVAEEIVNQKTEKLRDYALIKAQTKDYIRFAQARFILQPILDQLLTSLGSIQSVQQHLQEILAKLQEAEPLQSGYMGGNILNLLIELKVNLSGFDFSRLTISQAYLQGTPLQNVNFAHAVFSKSVFSKTFGAVLAVVFSNDGELLATSNTNGEIHIWRFPDGQYLLTCHGHTNWVRYTAFSPDKQYLASASDDRSIKIWSLADGQCIRTLGAENNCSFYSVNFSPNGQLLVSAGSDQIIRIWDWHTGSCIRELKGHSGWVLGVIVSPDSKYIASSSSDGTSRIWQVETGECAQILQGHTNWVGPIAFSPNSQKLISGSLDQTVRVWSVQTGDCLRILQGHSRWIWSVAVSPDGQRIASAGEDCTIRIWDAKTGDCLRIIKGHTSTIWCVTFHPDGQQIVSCSEDQTVRIWNAHNGQSLCTLQGGTNNIRSITFINNNQQLISGSKDGIIRIWDVQTHECLNMLKEHTDAILFVGLSPDRQTLASSSEDQTIKIWDLNHQVCLRTLIGHTSGIWSLSFNHNGCILASASFDQTIRFWDIENGCCFETLEGCARRTGSIVFNPDGDKLAVASGDNAVKIWNLKEKAWHTLEGHKNWVKAVAFNPDGRFLASGAIDCVVKLWDLESNICLRSLQGHTGWILSVAFSPDGRWIASSSCDRTVKIWSAHNSKCLQTLEGHSNWVWSVAFSSDGQILASAGEDGVIKLWNWHTGTEIATLRPKRLYEGMNITGATGLSPAQKTSLKTLGAVDWTA